MANPYSPETRIITASEIDSDQAPSTLAEALESANISHEGIMTFEPRELIRNIELVEGLDPRRVSFERYIAQKVFDPFEVAIAKGDDQGEFDRPVLISTIHSRALTPQETVHALRRVAYTPFETEFFVDLTRGSNGSTPIADFHAQGWSTLAQGEAITRALATTGLSAEDVNIYGAMSTAKLLVKGWREGVYEGVRIGKDDLLPVGESDNGKHRSYLSGRKGELIVVNPNGPLSNGGEPGRQATAERDNLLTYFKSKQAGPEVIYTAESWQAGWPQLMNLILRHQGRLSE